MPLENLSNEDLLEQYTDMVRWNHYDPMGEPRPSQFGLDALATELRRRLAKSSSSAE